MKKSKSIVSGIIVGLVLVIGIYCLSPWIMQKKAEQVKEGMTYEEVTRIMGKELGDRGSGCIIYAWELDKENEFWVWFYQNESGELVVMDSEIVEKE